MSLSPRMHLEPLKHDESAPSRGQSSPPTLHPIEGSALHALGWAALIGALEARARTPMGRGLCAALLPGVDVRDIAVRLARVEEARLLSRLDKEVPLADALDVRPALGRAARDGALEPAELLQIARLQPARAASCLVRPIARRSTSRGPRRSPICRRSPTSWSARSTRAASCSMARARCCPSCARDPAGCTDRSRPASTRCSRSRS